MNRPVSIFRWKRKDEQYTDSCYEMYEYATGMFHGWAIESTGEGLSSVRRSSAAIVEMDNGEVKLIAPTMLKFNDRD